MNKNVKDILVNTINSPEMEELFKRYEGNEQLLSQILGETISELVEEENPYRWKPVSPATFLTDPYYLGVNPNTGIGVCETLYPKLFEDFCKIHDPNSTIEEVVLTGSIGYGKSFFMELSILWQVYILSCFKNPQKYFKLAQASKISIMIISVTEKQSKKNIFATVKNMINAVPYFNDNFMFDDTRASESLLFPNNVEVFNGTSAQSSAIGLNIYSATLDEANFFKKVSKSKRAQNNNVYDEALILYNSLKRRQESRFLKGGRTPGILYIGSSKVYPNDFTAQRIKAAKKLTEETGVEKSYIMDYNLWVVNRNAYSKDEFQVEVGGMNSRSRILIGHETDIKGKVISIPMDFYDKFYGDIDNSIRDIAGEALFTVMPFIGNKNKIGYIWDNSINRIFSVDEATLSPKPEWLAIEYIIRSRKPTHPERPRYVAVDIGLKKDKFGFALGYIEDMVIVKTEFMNNETGEMEFLEERMPKIKIELLLEVKKEDEFGEVELSRVRLLIFQLMKQGFKVRYFSADGFQSADMQQILRRKGIKFEYISMDRTPEPYECLRDAIYQDRLSCIYHKTLERELNELERDYSKSGKIDHPPHGSKDIADAVGQLVYNATMNPVYADLTLLPITGNHDNIDNVEKDLTKNFDEWARKQNQ